MKKTGRKYSVELCLLAVCIISLLQNAPVFAGETYYVRASRFDTGTQVIETTNLAEAKKAAKKSSQYYVYNSAGEVVYPIRKTYGARIRRVVAWLKAIAKDNRHGFYCDPKLESKDGYRTTAKYRPYTKKTYLKIKGFGERDGKGYGDYNCSSAVIVAFREAGYADLPKYGGVCAGNFIAVAKKHGFKDVTSSIDPSTGAGLKKGDVLCCINRGVRNHMTVYLGGGKLFWAHSDRDERPGDGSGQELYIENYRNYFWSNVLRPTWHVVRFVDRRTRKVIKQEIVLHGENATAPEVKSTKKWKFAGWSRKYTKVKRNMTVWTVYEPEI